MLLEVLFAISGTINVAIIVLYCQLRSKYKERVRDLREEMLTDELTGTYNRKFYDNMMVSFIKTARRSVQPLSIIILDIDFFKDINDTYGHPFGDKVLEVIAATVEQAVRESDHVVRLGGEEFAVICPSTNLRGASVLSDKVREAVEEVGIRYSNNKLVHVTVSLGAAELRATDSEMTLYSRADEALYLAKETGRNKVVTK